MSLFKKKPTPVMNRAQALECIPVKSAAVSESRQENGLVLITYPIHMKPWMAKVVRRMTAKEPPPALKKLELDELGTEVWDLMDGTRTVRQVAQTLADRHQLHGQEAEVAVTTFIRQLGSRGLLGLK